MPHIYRDKYKAVKLLILAILILSLSSLNIAHSSPAPSINSTCEPGGCQEKPYDYIVYQDSSGPTYLAVNTKTGVNDYSSTNCFTTLANAVNNAPTGGSVLDKVPTCSMGSYADRIVITNTAVIVSGQGEGTVLQFPATVTGQNLWMFRPGVNMNRFELWNMQLDLNNVVLSGGGTCIPIALDGQTQFGGATFTIQRFRISNVRVINTPLTVGAACFNMYMDNGVNGKLDSSYLTGEVDFAIPSGGGNYVVDGNTWNIATLVAAQMNAMRFSGSPPDSMAAIGNYVKFPSGCTATSSSQNDDGFRIDIPNVHLIGNRVFGGADAILDEAIGPRALIVGNDAQEAWDANIQAIGVGSLVTGNLAYRGIGPGIMISNGAKNITVSGNTSMNNGQRANCPGVPTGAGVTDGIRLDTNVQSVLVSGNNAFDNQTVKTQGYAIREITTSNFNLITNNIVGPGATGTISIVGANTVVTGNLGYNPQAIASVTAGASPFTTTAVPYPQQIQITTLAGMTGWTCRGQTMINAVNQLSPVLGPGQTCILTWATTAPVYETLPQ